MLNEKETSRQEFRVYPDRSSVMRCMDMQALDEPVLNFSLDKHSKDALNISPSGNKRKKDREMCSSAKNAVNTNTCNEAIKAVISNNYKDNGTDECQEGCTNSTSPVPGRNCDNVSGKLCSSKTESSKCDTGGSCSVSLFRRISESEKFTDIDNGLKHGIQPILETLSPVRSESCPGAETINQSARSYGNPEINAIMDGENAIFPDLLPIKDTASDISDQSMMGDVTDNLLSPVKSEIESPGKSNSNCPQTPVSKEKADNVDEISGNIGNSFVKSSLSTKREKWKKVLEEGWKVDVTDQTTLAELYLMFGQNGELKLEYAWVTVKSEAEILQEKLLSNMDNMLRRLSHIATVEFTDFSKTPSAGSACQLCGQVQGWKQKGRGRDKVSPGKGRGRKTGKDVSIQTQPIDITKEMTLVPNPTVPVTSGMDGVFRVPVLMPNVQHKTTTTLSQKDLMSKMTYTAKPLMRPRKLKPLNRGRTGPSSIVQRTILPKNQLVTLFPVLSGGQVAGQNSAEKEVLSQTIVGHPINGIQTPPQVQSTSSQSILTQPGSLQAATCVTPEKALTATGIVEMSLSPEGDQTLMRIPASHIGTMSPKSLKAAGLSTDSLPLCIASPQLTTSVSTTSRNTTKVSISPPNLSSLLDISFTGPSNETSKFIDLVSDTTFSGILDDGSKGGLPLDPGLTTPPIRPAQDHPQSLPIHSPPVRSLFQPSPAPESQWMNGDVQELSLSSLFESPSKSSGTYSNTAMFNNTLPSSLFSESSRDSQTHKLDVDTTLHCMMNESSIDYVKKFQDLAEQIVDGDRG